MKPAKEGQALCQTGDTVVADERTSHMAETFSHSTLERELMLLIEASGALLSSPNSDDVLRHVLEVANRSMVADAYAVWGKKPGTTVWNLKMGSGLSDAYERVAFEDAPDLPFHGQPLAVEDVEQSPALQSRRSFYGSEGIRALLVVPLEFRGETAGTIVFYYRRPRQFSEAERRLSTALGKLAASALGSAEIYERELALRKEAERAERQASLLAEVGAVLSSSLDYETTLKRVAHIAVPTFADWCNVDVKEASGELRRVVTAHEDPRRVQMALEFRQKYPLDDTNPALIPLRTAKPVFVETVTDEMIVRGARNPEHLEQIRALGIRSVIMVPMLSRGRAVGTLTFVSAESGRTYDKGDLAFAEELGRRAANAIDNSQLHADIREREARFRQLANAVPALVWVTEADGTVSYLNDRWPAYTGIPAEESFGSGWSRIIHPDDVQRVLDAWQKATTEGTTYSVESRYRRADGAYRWFLARALPMRDEAGQILKWFGTSTEVHEAKETRETAQLLNRIGPTLAAELDPQKLTQSVTDIATRLTGAEFGALFQNVQNERGESYLLYTLSGVEREKFEGFPMPRNTAVFQPTFRGEGAVRSDDITQDPRYGKSAPYFGMPEGHVPVRSYLAVPVTSRSGEVLGGLFFGHSEPGRFTEWHERVVTGIAGQAAIALDNARLFADLRAARELAERSNEELRRANADLEQFAYSASHDLKEPLRMIAIFSQMLERQYREQLNGEASEYLSYIAEGARRMDKLVQDLLAYMQAGPTPDRAAAKLVDTDAVLSLALANLARAIEDSGAMIEREPLPPVFAAEVHLLQVFQNLIENAIKYRGADAPRITIGAARDGGLWRISIHDNGIGIAPEYRDQVFGIFKRLHTSDQYSGTGIGLAICQRIIARYGGRIWVESGGEGQGCTFSFTLPGDESGR